MYFFDRLKKYIMAPAAPSAASSAAPVSGDTAAQAANVGETLPNVFLELLQVSDFKYIVGAG